AGGGRAPAGQGRTPALPGEACKHSCSRALEPLEGRKGPAGGGDSRTGPETPPPHCCGRPGTLTTKPGGCRHTPPNLPENSGKRAPPHPPGRTHPPSRPLTGKGRVPIWTVLEGQNCAEAPSTAHQVSAGAGANFGRASLPARATHRPGETERQHDAVTFVATTGLEVEGVAPDDRSGPRAEAAGPPRRDAGL
ncbi:hypothetical protein MC885_005340, partial [Smutsia gigantea]